MITGAPYRRRREGSEQENGRDERILGVWRVCGGDGVCASVTGRCECLRFDGLRGIVRKS